MYFNERIETLERGDLDALVGERIRYTVRYASENSAFYRKWFRKNKVKPKNIRSHEDLLELPIISGQTMRDSQPPKKEEFELKSVGWKDVYTVHETSGTSGTPKTFFLTWDDWQRYAEKYARAFSAQGFGPEDRVVVCASYGMNVGANTMTLAASKIGMTIIPEGRCTFDLRVMRSYRPTGMIGSVFKFLNLARRMDETGVSPVDSGVKRLVIGGESFAEESRNYLSEVWGCEVYNIYGSTEGTMCGECTDFSGLHVTEDMVHLDVYDPKMKSFVKDGECGRMVLTTLIPEGEKCGTLLINYDTEDTTVVMSRERCACGRTHMKILYPQREAETFWVSGTPFNRVDVERGVFQRENMEYLTGEYEAFLYKGKNEGETEIKMNLECIGPENFDKSVVEENFFRGFFKYKPGLVKAQKDGMLKVVLEFKGREELEYYKKKGRPKRVVDLR